jgi:hypothetical protein
MPVEHDPHVRTPQAQDGGSLFSGLSGWWKQIAAFGIFGVLAWYAFFQVPAMQQEAREHGERMFNGMLKNHQDDMERRDAEVKSVFIRLLDGQSQAVSLQKVQVDTQKTQLDFSKKILSATQVKNKVEAKEKGDE